MKSSIQKTKFAPNPWIACCGSLAFLLLMAQWGRPETPRPLLVVPPTTLVAPNNLDKTEGNADNGSPFTTAPFSGPQRNQQVYGASEFSALASGGGLITQLRFRPDGPFGHSFTSTLPNVQIDLSTTLKGNDSLSPVFANNIGADHKVVFGKGPLTLSSAFTGATGGPKDFDIVINLTTPFLYNPALGNLLLDVRNFVAVPGSQFDAENTAGDSVSRVFAEIGSEIGATDSYGLATEFKFAPIPEPGTMSLLVLGIVSGLGVIILQRTERRNG